MDIDLTGAVKVDDPSTAKKEWKQVQNGKSPNAPLVDILNNKEGMANEDHDLTGFEDELG